MARKKAESDTRPEAPKKPRKARSKPADPIALADHPDLEALAAADHADPFAILGMHEVGGHLVVRAFLPGADAVTVVARGDSSDLAELELVHEAGIFAGVVPEHCREFAYRLKARWGSSTWEFEDAYRFGPIIGEVDEYLVSEGSHRRLYEILGAHPRVLDGVSGTGFAVWAPMARRVSVVGDFNGWDGRRHMMRPRGVTGVWEIFLPDVGEGACYKYEIRAQDGRVQPLKTDPFAFYCEQPPGNASIVHRLRDPSWHDANFLKARGGGDLVHQPVSIYEVHLGSWRRGEFGRKLSYRELAETLPAYAAWMGFTHIELLPVNEHPYEPSWGYQPTGLFAPTSRFGPPDDFALLIDACHRAGLGVILDWVPGHFPSDAHGLARFDGTCLYEHEDPRLGYHPDWATYIYNYGRPEVRNFLIANVLYWLKRFHIDGLRVDAVASMLYLDYSRRDGEWLPNIHGGRENLEAVEFLRSFNETVYAEAPGIATIAEESTAWPQVSRPTSGGGLGFGFKWNMGWMNDTLDYMRRDPIHRFYHHNQMTFGLTYAFSENFVLPLSHDEVVHGKGSLIGKMPGDDWQKFANLRSYFAFMWCHPGKKLLFMGGEFAQRAEWNHDQSLDWHLVSDPRHRGMQLLVRDLNHLYREMPALHRFDSEMRGFSWLEVDNAAESIFAFARWGEEGDKPALVLCNFTPVARRGKRIGLPWPGRWREAINSDAWDYGGSGFGNGGAIESEPVPSHGFGQSALVDLPPLATVIFVPDN
ncbi:MAG: 1,4-alpha-glucan branching protein GlgB [Hyphomicrobiales bacterium]